MVAAEVPLWVVHNNTDAKEANNGLGSKNKVEKRAAHSLSLLQNKKKSAIYSVDCCDNVFATAGGDGTVRIWNTNALFSDKFKGGKYSEVDQLYHSTTTAGSSENETSSSDSEPEQHPRSQDVHDLSSAVRRKKDKANATSSSQASSKTSSGSGPASANQQDQKEQQQQPQQLHRRLVCNLSAHSGSSVLAVRFSNNGLFLASAGDDGSVCIYREGDDDGIWFRIRILRGHNLDVVGLTWSPDDSYLVSCSLDSETPIIVWKTADLADPKTTSMIAHPYKTLGVDVHTSTVKGVAFDPAGSYLCSSGDDPALCLWRANDDWGLERKIQDIFPRHTHDPAALSAQSLFRRVSWATDGSFVCSTNAVVKNKHVASTVSRQGWKSTGEGAAHLVGHKQPVVVSRCAPELIRHKRAKNGGAAYSGDPDDSESDDDENVPEYATLMALGDKRGCITLWSTKKARPVFRMQCSESHCQVTDLAWGRLENDVILLVSLLDGQIVALRFSVPTEFGTILSKDEKARVFESRYGIQTSDDFGQQTFRSRGQSELIENAFHLTMDDDNDDGVHDNDDDVVMDDDCERPAGPPAVNVLNNDLVRSRQKESTSKSGKKRVQPMLMNVAKKPKTPPPTTTTPAPKPPPKAPADPMQAAMDAAKKASEAAKNKQQNQSQVTNPPSPSRTTNANGKSASPLRQQSSVGPSTMVLQEQIPYSKNKSFSIELPVQDSDSMDIAGESRPVIAEFNNINKVPVGSKMKTVPCIDISVSRGGKVSWKDQIPGSSCTAIAASTKLLAIGTADGCLYLFGTSASLGWACEHCFRSHPPLIFGNAIVSVQLRQDKDSSKDVKLLVLTSDGSFGLYSVIPTLKLLKKGSVLPAMTHMALSSGAANLRPKVSRIQTTETGRILLLLSYLPSTMDSPSPQRGGSRGVASVDSGVGGSIQAFFYEMDAELWIRISDSRFILSDFYSILPSKSKIGELSNTDDLVRTGSVHSSLKLSQRSKQRHADEMFAQAKTDVGNFIPTRAHCEDRLACAVALESASEFKHWLSLYVRVLVSVGNEPYLRILIDQIRGKEENGNASEQQCSWWLGVGATVMGLDRLALLKTVIVPEMSKNRALQRMTNEIVAELNV